MSTFNKHFTSDRDVVNLLLEKAPELTKEDAEELLRTYKNYYRDIFRSGKENSEILLLGIARLKRELTIDVVYSDKKEDIEDLKKFIFDKWSLRGRSKNVVWNESKKCPNTKMYQNTLFKVQREQPGGVGTTEEEDL